MIFSPVWYADQERIASPSKSLAMSDKGDLVVLRDSLTFKGAKTTLEISKPDNIFLAGQQIPWRNYLFLNVPIFMAIGLCFCIFVSQVQILAPENLPLTLPVLFFLILFAAIIIVGNLLGIIVALKTKWICVEYENAKTVTQRAYFADGTNSGWSGLFGGTHKLYSELRNVYGLVTPLR